MKINKTLLALVATLGLGVSAAHAGSLALGGLPTGQIANPGSFSADFYANAVDASATIDFSLKGYKTLDGMNNYEDLFTLTINNTQIGSGAFNLGGGGADLFTWTPSNTGAYVNSNTGTAIGGNGGTVTFSGVVFGLNVGKNTVVFSYVPVKAGAQGLGDEAWGVGNATVSSKVATISAVPEPESYAMMLAGLGLMGAIARRRKSKAA